MLYRLEDIFMDDNFYPKITNYGYTHYFQHNIIHCNTDEISEYKKSLIYMDSEILHFKVLCMIVTSTIPLTNLDDNYFSKIRNINHLSLDGISESYRDLIEKCLSQDQDDRPTFDEIVEKLKNDQGFITEKVNIKEYNNYIKFIEVDYYSESNESHKTKSFVLNLSNIFSLFDFIYQIIDKTPEIQYKIGKYYTEGLNNITQNIEFGMNYIMKLVSNENINAILYLSELLIEGKYIPQNLPKAKNYIMNFYKTNHQAFILYGKNVNIENNPIEIIKYNQFGSLNGDTNCIHEYGKYLFENIEKKSIDIK